MSVYSLHWNKKKSFVGWVPTKVDIGRLLQKTCNLIPTYIGSIIPKIEKPGLSQARAFYILNNTYSYIKGKSWSASCADTKERCIKNCNQRMPVGNKGGIHCGKQKKTYFHKHRLLLLFPGVNLHIQVKKESIAEVRTFTSTNFLMFSIRGSEYMMTYKQ